MSARRELTLTENKKDTVSFENKENQVKDSGHSGLNLSAVYVLLAGSLWGFMGLLVRTLNAEGLDSMVMGTTFFLSIKGCLALINLMYCLSSFTIGSVPSIR